MEKVIEQSISEMINNRNYIIVKSKEGVFLPKFYGGINDDSSIEDKNENYYNKISRNFFITRAYDAKLENDNVLEFKEMNSVILHLKNTLSKEEVIALVKKIGVEVTIVEYNYLGEVLFEDIFKVCHITDNSFHFDNNKKTKIN